MKEQSRRSKRMASQVQGRLAQLLIEEAQDPRLSSCSITEVVMTNDLKQAKVFFDCHTDAKEVLRGLKRATPFFRRELARALESKHVPELIFEKDSRAEKMHHLMEVLGSLPESLSGSSNSPN